MKNRVLLVIVIIGCLWGGILSGEGKWNVDSDSAATGFWFIRGDVTSDGIVALSDAVAIVQLIFSSRLVACEDAADVNDDGQIDISDAVYLFYVICQADEPLPSPSGRWGPDPTEDPLDCWIK